MIRKIEIDDENLNSVDFIDESGNWYCISHSGTDVYDVEEMVKEGRKYEGNVIMLVNFENENVTVKQISEKFEQAEKDMGLSIHVQREEIFTSMHRI